MTCEIDSIESLHADGGWRTFDFLKITAGNGLAGWSEYNESFGGVGVTAAIEDGLLTLPTGPGWGAEVNEDVVRAHPAKP